MLNRKTLSQIWASVQHRANCGSSDRPNTASDVPFPDRRFQLENSALERLAALSPVLRHPDSKWLANCRCGSQRRSFVSHCHQRLIRLADASLPPCRSAMTRLLVKRGSASRPGASRRGCTAHAAKNAKAFHDNHRLAGHDDFSRSIPMARHAPRCIISWRPIDEPCRRTARNLGLDE